MSDPSTTTFQSPITAFNNSPAREELSTRRRQKVLEILAAVDGTCYLSGTPPRVIVAAAVYLSGKLDDEPPLSQLQVAQMFDTTTASIRNHYRQLALYHADAYPDARHHEFDGMVEMRETLPTDDEGCLR